MNDLMCGNTQGKTKRPALCEAAVLVSLILLVFGFFGCSGGGGGGGSGGGGGGGGGNTVTYTVSGTIFVEANTAIDSDVNDPHPDAVFASNDDFETAQSILDTPVVLGGYVNVTGQGAPGRFYDPQDPSVQGDQQDYFSVTIAQDQTILLNISDGDANANLDLFLYEGESPYSQIAASESGNDTESLTIAETGDYIVEVRAVSGASNYTLTIGQAVGTAGFDGRPPGGDFVPGEVIVKFKENPLETHRALDSQDMRSMGFDIKSGRPGQSMLLRFDAPEQKARVFRSLGLASPRAADAAASLSGNKGIDELETLQVIRALNGLEAVEYAEPNYIVRPLAIPDDEFYPLQWHYPFIHLPEAWDVTQGSGNVIVAVIDTGVLLDHPDLQGKLVDGYDFISDVNSARDGDGLDSDPDDPGDSDIGQSSFHGTHVSGTIAAATGNSSGVAGVGWNVKVMPVRALGQEGGTIADLVEAVKYAAGLENASGTLPAQKADIINMSIGHSGFSNEEKAAIDLALDAGVIIVAAAGNESTSTPSYPAAYDGVVSVGAVNIQGDRASYSNFGSTLHVMAPGGDTGDLNNDGYPDAVLSTMGDDSGGTIEMIYGFMAGTSMASPHVAGVTALMKSLNSAMEPGDLDAYLTGGALTFDLGDVGFDNQFGYGLIDAQKAVSAVQESPPTVLLVSPSILYLDEDEETGLLTTEISGTGSLTITAVTTNQAWLTVTQTSAAGEEPVVYTATVDRNSLKGAGIFTAEVNFQSTVNEVKVPVYVASQTADEEADAGLHYVQIIDYDILASGIGDPRVDQVEVAVSSGIYTYSFSGIPAGRYIVYASTDSDNDFELTDSGEAFGAYSSWQQPVVVTVDRNRAGLDFTTGFKINLPASQTMYTPLQAIIENKPNLIVRVK